MPHQHTPLMEHDHKHDGEHAHDHHHPLTVIEEPLDPANQSLADALRASFRILKVLMLSLVVIFLFSGVFIVDQNEVCVLVRLGKQSGAPKEPGLHFAFPSPIDEKVRVSTAPKTVDIDPFWLRLSKADEGKDLSQLTAQGSGLDPATNGALLTGDHALMHLLLQVQYRITGANDFVRNVSNENNLLRSILQNATVAEAARSTAEVLWKDPSRLTAAIKTRAQSQFDALQTGITLETVIADKSHYPLQVKQEFLAVSDAENKMRQLVQEANKIWEEKLKGAAGPAWEKINREIEKLDQTGDESKRDAGLQTIDKILTEEATGEAGRQIQLAEGTRDRMVAEAQSQAERFTTFLAAYKQNPHLVRARLMHGMLNQIFSQASVSRWFVPEGEKFITLNKDPEEVRQQERDRIRKKTGR